MIKELYKNMKGYISGSNEPIDISKTEEWIVEPNDFKDVINDHPFKYALGMIMT